MGTRWDLGAFSGVDGGFAIECLLKGRGPLRQLGFCFGG